MTASAVPNAVAFVAYDPETGEIKFSGTCPDFAYEVQAPGFAKMLGHGFPSMHYILDGVITLRPTVAFDTLSIAADGEATATLAGLPVPATVVVNGEAHVVTDGTLELAAETPTTFDVVFDQFPYRRYEARVTAA